MLLAPILCPLAADAQSPQRVSTTTSAVTVAKAGVFQQALPSASRNSCTVQYNGLTIGYVFFGPIANATTPTAFQLTSTGQSINCNVYGVVLTDAVNVTGAAGDIFVVTTQ